MAGLPQQINLLLWACLGLAWISDYYFKLFLFPSVTSESTVNAVQWRHYSFALIHAKSKTQFSAGKQRNIVSKCLHDTELLYSFSLL